MLFSTIRNRVIITLVLVGVAAANLIPREITVRERDPETGQIRDVTERQVPLKLGLDLQGGMHLQLELDQSKRVSANPSDDIDKALQVLRKRMEGIGVQEPLVQKQGEQRIVVELAGITDPNRAIAIVQKNAFLEFRMTDRSEALDKALPAMDRALARLGVTAGPGAQAPVSAVQQLLQGDSAKPEAQQDTTPVTGGALSGLIEPASQAGVPGVPGEYVVEETAVARVDSFLTLPDVKALFPRNYEYRWSANTRAVGGKLYRMLYVLEDRALVTGENLENAQEQLDPLTNGPIVTFQLNRTGGRKFGEGTARNVGNYMAIVLDDRVQGQPPVIQERIERRGQITLTGKTLQEARDLALTLRAGALPVPLKIVAERQVRASLGEDSIRKGILAGVVGTVLVVVIMIGIYRLSGLLAVAALALYMLFTLGLLAMAEATLTLPGIAGLVLSIGIAVDANVLIFERIREELQLGKTVRLSVEEGFKHAMAAIIDSNVSTVLTALFLFQFGTGPVKGFAVTLIIGIASSMVTAVFVTRTFYMIWLDRRPTMQTLSI